MKTLNQVLNIAELYEPKSADEKRFVDKHVVVKHADRNGNDDDVFKAKKIKAIKRSPEHGHEVGKDHEVYEEAELELEDVILEDAVLKNAMIVGPFQGTSGANGMSMVILDKNKKAHAKAKAHFEELKNHKRRGVPHDSIGRVPRNSDLAAAENKVNNLVHVVHNNKLNEEVLDEQRGYKAPELEAAGYKFKSHTAGSEPSTLYHHPELDKHIEIVHEKINLPGWSKRRHVFFSGKFAGGMQTRHLNLEDAIKRNAGALKEQFGHIDESLKTRFIDILGSVTGVDHSDAIRSAAKDFHEKALAIVHTTYPEGHPKRDETVKALKKLHDHIAASTSITDMEHRTKKFLNYAQKGLKEEAEALDESAAKVKNALFDGGVHPDQVSKTKDGHITVRSGYFYKHGQTSDSHTDKIKKALDKAGIKHTVVDDGDHWAPFRGGASVARSSHFYTTVKLHESTEGLDEQNEVTKPIRLYYPFLIHTKDRKGKLDMKIRINAGNQEHAEKIASQMVGQKPYRGLAVHQVVKEDMSSRPGPHHITPDERRAAKDRRNGLESYRTPDGRWVSRPTVKKTAVKEEVSFRDRLLEEKSKRPDHFVFTHTPGDKDSETKLTNLKKMVKAHNKADEKFKLRVIAKGRLGQDNPNAEKYRKGGEIWNKRSHTKWGYKDSHKTVWGPLETGERSRGYTEIHMKDAKHHDIYVLPASKDYSKTDPTTNYSDLHKRDIETRRQAAVLVRAHKTLHEEALSEAPYYSLQASKERMAKEKARAEKKAAAAAAKSAEASKRKEDKVNLSQKVAQHVEAEVGNHYPDSDGYDAIASKVRRMGIPDHKVHDHIEAAVRKHLGAKSFGHYVDNFHSDYKRDNINEEKPDVYKRERDEYYTYSQFIAEQVRRGDAAGFRSITEEVTNSMVHQHAGAMHAAKTLRPEGVWDGDAKAHAKKIEDKVAAKHGKGAVTDLRAKSKAAVRDLNTHIRAANKGSGEAQRKVDSHPVMKHAEKWLEDLY